MSRPQNSEFEFLGVNHLALVSSDMQHTVDFYQGLLGMPLIKTIDLPRGMGQHFFFDLGNGDSLAFFWFPDAPKAQPGVALCRTRHAAGTVGARLDEPHRDQRAGRAHRRILRQAQGQGRRVLARHQPRRPRRCRRAWRRRPRPSCARSISTIPTASRSSSPPGRAELPGEGDVKHRPCGRRRRDALPRHGSMRSDRAAASALAAPSPARARNPCPSRRRDIRPATCRRCAPAGAPPAARPRAPRELHRAHKHP